MCFGYTDVHYSSYARVGAFINASSKFLFAESMYSTWCHIYEVYYIVVFEYCIGFNIGRFNEGIVIVGYCEDREV